jgi:Na+-transporting methylmalonyl-CoA/oxaloacetate decarboxylase beta subunit
MKRIISIILILLAIALMYLGITNSMLPPTLTGIGFIAIAVVFLTDKTNP